LGVVYADQALAEYDMAGRPTAELPEENPVVQSAFAMFDKIVH
jgi:hypothetical protein